MLVTQRVNKLFLCKKNLGKSHVINHPCNSTVAYGILDNADRGGGVEFPTPTQFSCHFE